MMMMMKFALDIFNTIGQCVAELLMIRCSLPDFQGFLQVKWPKQQCQSTEGR